MSELVLATERLELWRPQASDLDGLNAINTDPRTLTFLGNWASGRADSVARLLRNAGGWSFYGYGVCMIRRRGAAQIIGTCGVFRSYRGFAHGLDDVPEAGWIVHPDHWGQGYASEAMRAALAWFDEVHGAQRIACMIETGNAASQRLAAKLGFVEYTRHVDAEGKELVLYERV